MKTLWVGWVTTMPLQSGQILNNCYCIDRLLGQGGFGAVYQSKDERTTTNMAPAVTSRLHLSWAHVIINAKHRIPYKTRYRAGYAFH